MGKQGILNCAATSNSNVNIDIVGDIPTGCMSEYLVSVTQHDYSFGSFAGYGLNHIDIAAPGTNIYGPGSGTNNYYSSTGTSFASPHVCGAIALMYSVLDSTAIEKSLIPGKNDAGQVARDIKQKLLESASLPNNQITSSTAGQTTTGGRLNLRDALIKAQEIYYDTQTIIDINDIVNHITTKKILNQQQQQLADIDYNGTINVLDIIKKI